MSQNNPITISSWSLGDQCSLDERISLRAENYVNALDSSYSPIRKCQEKIQEKFF